MRYTVAAVQFEPRFGDKVHNVGQLLALTREAATAGARLVVLPEMATTGYCFRSRQEIAPLVEPVPGGETCQAFADLARELGLHVVVGLAEVDPVTGIYYNTAALIGPEGFIGKYRKTHSYVDETRWARDGDLGHPVFETALGRIGIIICMDADYMEPARLEALAGADVIAFPTNWLGDQTTWYARAVENGLYFVAANRWGEERGTKFAGHSCVISPEGIALNLLSTGDGLALAEVDTAVTDAARTMALALRRPEQYHDLVISSYLWSAAEAQLLPAGQPVAVAVGQAQEGAQMGDQVRWADLLARESGWPKVDLVVFPVVDGAEVSTLAALAETLDCYVAWGTRSGGREEAWLVGPDGLAGRTEQVHGAGAQGEADAWQLIDLPWGRVGLITGADLRVPEAARVLAKRGADMIVAPAAWESENDRLLWKARCLENDTPVVVANRFGGSRIFQAGETRALKRPAQGITAMAQVDTSNEAARAKELLRKLQPRWYVPLVRSI